MTYCVGVLLEDGIVLGSDSRTHAGVDDFASFCKMTVFEEAGERVLVLLSSGSLAGTQAVISLLRQEADAAAEAAADAEPAITIRSARTMFDVARVVSDAMRAIDRRDSEHLEKHDLSFNASFILGGQIKGEEPRLFHVYSAGNFIESSLDTPYFQIGESKYGKPIIDRVISRSSSLAQAAKCALVSMDSTIRSNLSVGPPLDLAIIRRDEFTLHTHISLDMDNEYFKMIRTRWGYALQEVFSELPNPEW